MITVFALSLLTSSISLGVHESSAESISKFVTEKSNIEKFSDKDYVLSSIFDLFANKRDSKAFSHLKSNYTYKMILNLYKPPIQS